MQVAALEAKHHAAKDKQSSLAAEAQRLAAERDAVRQGLAKQRTSAEKTSAQVCHCLI